jgi:hypothetical protein
MNIKSGNPVVARNYCMCLSEVRLCVSGVRTVLVLDEDARPAVLQSCHPRGDSRFSLQTRRGGLVKIYDSVLMSGVSSHLLPQEKGNC